MPLLDRDSSEKLGDRQMGQMSELVSQFDVSDQYTQINYNDENALSCVISLAYYNAVNEYTHIREFPTGKGFADIVFLPRKGSECPAMIIELKYDKSAKGAIQQIKDKKYVSARA